MLLRQTYATSSYFNKKLLWLGLPEILKYVHYVPGN